MTTLKGDLQSSTGKPPASWLGFRVEVNYPVSVPLADIEGDAGSEPESSAPTPNSVEARREKERLKASGKAPPGVKPASGTRASQKPRNATVMDQVVVDVASDGSFSRDLGTVAQGPVQLKALGFAREVLATQNATTKELDRRVTLTVSVPEVGAITARSMPLGTRKPRLTGRVINLTPKVSLGGRRVFILGIEKGATPQAAGGALAPSTTAPIFSLVTATLDAGGNFFADYPVATLKGGAIGPRALDRAYALIDGGQSPNGTAEISIGLSKLGDEASALPLEVTLVVKFDEPSKTEAPCDCDSPVPRVPTAIDLANAPETYSEDLGTGGCVKLTTPNRALEEFSFYTAVRTTDPEFVAQGHPTLDLSGRVVSPKTIAISTYVRNIGMARSRAPLSSTNAINWDDADVNQPGFFEATSVAHGHLLQFKQVWRADGYSLGDLLYSLPLAPGQKKQIAIIDWERRESASRSESTTATDQLDNLLARDRDISDIVSTTLKEHSHGESDALTVGSAHGSGAAAGGGSGGASFGGLSGTSMSGGYSQASATQDSARDLVASAVQRIHDQTMQAASAVRSMRSSVIQTVTQGERVEVTTEVVANHNHCHAMTIEYFEVLRHFRVTTELADVKECLYIPLPMTPFVPKKVQRWRDLLATYLRKSELAPAFDANDRVIALWADSDYPLARFADERVRFLEGQLTFIVRAPRKAPDAGDTARKLVDEAGEYLPDVVKEIGDTVMDFLGIGGSSGGPAPLVTNTQLSMKISRSDGSNTQPVYMQFTMIDEFAPNRPLRVRMRIADPKGIPVVSRADIGFVQIAWPANPGGGFPEGCQLMILSAAMRYHTPHMHRTLFDEPNLGAGLAVNSVLIETPLDAEELRNPRQEDLTGQRKLILHLNQHLEYYHKAIWWSMDSDRRFMLLDGYLAPTSGSMPPRSLAAVVENRLIGFVGNSMVMPVGHGIHLDPSYAIDSQKPVDLRDFYPRTLLPPARVSLPTKGVFAEAVMGDCNSCEQKEETRFWRWNEVPTGDEPVPIVPPSADSRRSETPNLAPTPFPAPLVSIQGPPALPDPTALDAALRVIGTANLFRDITGLDATQKAAVQAMITNTDAAKYYAGEASKLAQQQSMKDGGIDKTMQSIQDAKKAGLLDDTKAQSAMSTAIDKLIGADNKKALTEDTAVKKTIESAAEKPASKVSVKRGDESVDVDTSTSSGGSSLIAAAYVSPEAVGDVTSTASYPLFESLTAALKANPFKLDAALDIVEKSLVGWSDYRVDLKFSNPPKYPGPGVEGLRDSAVYVCGNILLYIAKGSTDTDGRTNNIGTNPNLETSYKVRAADGTLKSLDAFADAYFVMSQTVLGLCGSRSKAIPAVATGTLGYVTSSRNNTSSYAVYGDAGPCHSAGEISVALAQALGYTINNPAKDSAEDQPTPGLRYVVLLGTSKSRNTADVAAAALATEGNGIVQDHLRQYAWHLLNRAVREAPGGGASTDGTVTV